jgi:hypothetical protein
MAEGAPRDIAAQVVDFWKNLLRTTTHESPVTFNAGTLPASGVNFFRSV